MGVVPSDHLPLQLVLSAGGAVKASLLMLIIATIMPAGSAVFPG